MKAVVLLENELLDLKDQFEGGAFAKLIATVSTTGNQQLKIKLAGRIVTKTSHNYQSPHLRHHDHFHLL